ncbi:hypothetical protein AB4225_14515 [Streptomyces sp. 2RAF24]|uniref:hypothetical protein n=1 Tax=Streptomyces sp. 2RAF24 TaxID=3232997 RepID=UPI003F9C3697
MRRHDDPLQPLDLGKGRMLARFFTRATHRGSKIRTISGPRSGIATEKPTFVLVRKMPSLYRQQTKNLLVSYSPKKLGFF